MPTNPDDVDDLLRGAMKVLDDEVPSGYFDGLPSRTLARLEGNGMHTQSSGIESGDDTNPVLMQEPVNNDQDRAPTGADREEDSGLHDIRSLATSTKARLSRRITVPPVDEDILASSSAGWKAVALPEPAKMVSLPELADLPSMAQVQAATEAKRSRRDSKKSIAPAVAAPVAAPAIDDLAARRAEVAAAPATSMSTMPAFGSGMLKQQTPKKNKTALIAVVGMGLAAAAGAAIFVATKNQGADTAAKPEPSTVARSASAPTATATAIEEKAPEPVAAAPAAPPPAEIASGAAADSAAVAAIEPADVEPDGKSTRSPSKKGAKPAKEKIELDLSKDQPKVAEKADKPKPGPSVGGAGAGGGEPDQSFDDLLKEAGVKDKGKVEKVALEKKSLSGDDIRKGMQSVAQKAQACYAGTQGTASVKLTVAPSGQVQKVTVTGVFAGTPVAACVSGAIQGITFPAWDGGPQSINYSYLLAE